MLEKMTFEESKGRAMARGNEEKREMPNRRVLEEKGNSDQV